MPDSGRCSVASANRQEAVAGTAPAARRWVLIEHPGPWDRQALETPPFKGDLGQRLSTALDAYAASLLLVRRTGRQVPGEARIWRVVDTATGMSLTGSWRTDSDLEALLPALAGCAGPLSEPAPLMVMVCTHGTRDACCAIKGRPIAGAVARALPDVEVWECTHLGGHRFAGTALVLPDGACYGRLDQLDAAKVLAGHLRGEVRADKLRGVTWLVPAAQAAHAWGLQQLTASGPAALADVSIGAVVDAGDDVTRVEVVGLRPHDEGLWVEVRRHDLADAPLSCGKAPKSTSGWTVEAPVAVS